MNSDKLTYGGLFEGIGAFARAASEVGFQPIWSVDFEPYCCRILNKNFNHKILNADVKDCGKNKKYELEKVDIICGGFPCQNISQSGNGKGIKGGKSSLAYEMLRICREISPKYIIAENSDNLTKKGLEYILCEVAEMGYNAEWGYLPASAFGAYHKRPRTYFVAYPTSNGFKRILQGLEKGDKLLPKASDKIKFYSLPKSFDQLGDHKRIRTHDGVSNLVDRIKAMGNSIYYPIALAIMKSIKNQN